jgi:hypothetical protein
MGVTDSTKRHHSLVRRTKHSVHQAEMCRRALDRDKNEWVLVPACEWES